VLHGKDKYMCWNETKVLKMKYIILLCSAILLNGCCQTNTIYTCTYSENSVSTNGELATEYLRVKEELKICSGIAK